MPRYNITVKLIGEDGNAFAIIGKIRKALRYHLRRELALTQEDTEAELERFRSEAMSGDYDHLLQTAMNWVEVS